MEEGIEVGREVGLGVWLEVALGVGVGLETGVKVGLRVWSGAEEDWTGVVCSTGDSCMTGCGEEHPVRPISAEVKKAAVL